MKIFLNKLIQCNPISGHLGNNLFQYSRFYFARNVGRRIISEGESNPGLKIPMAGIKERVEISKEQPMKGDRKGNKEEFTEPNEEAELNISELDRMVYSIYQKSKYHVLDANRRPLEQHERHLKYYNFITQHLKKLNNEQMVQFIRAICYFKYKDDKTNDILSSYLNSSKNKLPNASLVLYALSNLELENEGLKQQALKIIESSDFASEKKEAIIPMIHSLTEWNISNEILNTKIDEFVRVNEKDFNEHVRKDYNLGNLSIVQILRKKPLL
jgi:hypothetical protein